MLARMPNAPLPTPASLAPAIGAPEPPAEVPMSAARPACAVCDAELLGAFCATCGERAPTPDDESLAAFLRDQFHEVTSADGRLWRTLRALFVPGKLTDEFFAGRRGLYVRPVRLFLVLNVLLFLWVGWFGGQGFVGDASFYRSNWRFAQPMTAAAAAAGVSDAVYDAAFSQRARVLAPTLIAVFIPAFALAFALVLAPARRPLVRHAVFATHYVAVLMATTVLGSLMLALPLVVVLALTGEIAYNMDDSVTLPVFLVLWSAYLVVGIRRVYGVPWWGAGAAGLVLATAGTLMAMEAYRTALYLLTSRTLDVPT